MSESEWIEEASAPAPQRKRPVWPWFCGGGCLILLLLAAAGAWIVSDWFQSGRDPDKQWPEIARILPYDERPEELELIFGSRFLADMYLFNDSRGYTVLFLYFDEDHAEAARKQVMDPEYTGGVPGLGERRDAELGTITIQGRELPILRYFQYGEEVGGEDTPPVLEGAAATIELTPEGDPGFLCVTVIRASNADEPVPDDYLRELLAPFHVGPDR